MAEENNKVFITQEGLDELKTELKELKETKRKEVAQRIKEARDMGDLSENAEYQAAKEEQGLIESRIAELEDIIKRAVVAEASSNGEVAVGNKVTIHIDGDKQTFHLVGAPEANPKEGKISHESPLGSTLMGKKEGDTFEVEAPVGTLTYKIVKIH